MKEDIVETLREMGENKSEALKRIEQRLKKAENTDSSDFYFSLWDFGGQSFHYITHQVFLAYRVIYIFVTDLTKGLDDILELEPQDQTARYWKEDMPLKDYMRFWTNSIHTHAMRDFAIKAHGQDESEEHTIVAPPVIIAGTKKDLLEGDVEKESQVRLCKLREYLRQHTKSAWDSHVTFPMFALDNKSRQDDKTTDPSVERLRKRIQELAKEFCFLGEISVNWLILELTLRSEEKETLQLSEVHRLGKERDLSTAEINDALKYFHDVGEIIHFADVRELKDTVIIDPRWLINLFRLLITNTVSYKTNPELSSELLKMFDELYNHGRMKKELVSQWLKLHDRQQDTDILLKVLEMFDIICQSTLEIDVYYFPCLLQSKLQENVLFPSEYKSCDPLYFHFRGNFLPEGLYYRLIVRCLRQHSEAVLFQDHARFIHNESNDHHFTLCRKGADIELKMLRPDILGERIIPHLYEKVRQEVETSLNELIRMYTPGLTYHICVKCACGDHRDGIWIPQINDIDDGCTDITPVLDQGVKQLHCARKKMLVNVSAISYWYKESRQSPSRTFEEIVHLFCYLDSQLDSELTLRSEEKETLQLSDVHRLGKERDLSTEEIEKALKYFHDVGEIIHFADVDELKNTVIIDPRWLINLFRLLITNTVTYRTNPEVSYELLNMFDELYNLGRMKKELVLQWLTLHDRQQDTDILLKVLEMFDIICKDQSTLGIDVYYFPCLLQSEPRENVLFPSGYKSCEPLYFHFCGNFLPEGLYYRLIVRCLRQHPKAVLFQDHARFIHNESNNHYFTLCRKGADIELKMLRPDTLGERIIQYLYEKVRQEVETSLKELIRMYTPGLTYHICVKCGCGDHRDGIWLPELNDIDDGCTDITPVLNKGVEQLHCARKQMPVNISAISYWYKESRQSPSRTFEEIVHLFCYLDSQLDSDHFKTIKSRCIDYIPYGILEKKDGAFDVFYELSKRLVISPRNTSFLEDLLSYAGKQSLVTLIERFHRGKTPVSVSTGGGKKRRIDSTP
ncbi:uncharacterized protein LOC102801256 [Saccoglossus kowalevskii]